LANGFALGSTQSYTTGKQYIDEQKAVSLSSVVYDSGMVSISALVLGEAEKGEIGKILLSAYGQTVSNWVAANIESKDFSQTFDKNDTIGGFNIDISISGEIGSRKLNITITPGTQNP
jgi:methionine salvage enolase-phosphatase E1